MEESHQNLQHDRIQQTVIYVEFSLLTYHKESAQSSFEILMKAIYMRKCYKYHGKGVNKKQGDFVSNYILGNSEVNHLGSHLQYFLQHYEPKIEV